MKYISPALYRSMGYGADTSQLDDEALGFQIEAASALVNRFCNQPRGFDFRGGSVTGEQHQWTIGNGYAPGTQRLWPDCRPVTECNSFLIQVTNTQYLNVTPELVFLNKQLNYLEPVIAASSIGIWSYTQIPIAGLHVPVAKIDYTYGYSFTETDEVLSPEGGQTWRAAHQWWTDDPVSVTVNNLDIQPSVIDMDEGTVTLPEMVDSDDVVRASYTHRLPWEIRDATALVTTQLLGTREIVAAGMSGLSGIRVEEVELRQSRDALAARQEISGLAATLLIPFKWQGFA